MEELGHHAIVMVDRHQRPVGFVELDNARNRRGTVAEHHAALPAVAHLKADLRTAVSEMFTHDMTWLPVVDDEGRFKGYVTQRGITHALGETYRG